MKKLRDIVWACCIPPINAAARRFELSDLDMFNAHVDKLAKCEQRENDLCEFYQQQEKDRLQEWSSYCF